MKQLNAQKICVSLGKLKNFSSKYRTISVTDLFQNNNNTRYGESSRLRFIYGTRDFIVCVSYSKCTYSTWKLAAIQVTVSHCQALDGVRKQMSATNVLGMRKNFLTNVHTHSRLDPDPDPDTCRMIRYRKKPDVCV